MNNGPRSPGRTGRLSRSVAVLGLILALGATACSGNSSSNGGHTATPDAKLASKSLTAGLKAYTGGDLSAAAVDFRKTLKYDKKNKYALYNLALIDAANGNYGLAESHYRAALTVDPKFDPALFNLGILRAARKDPKQAISLYKRAVASNKADAAAWLNLGLLLRANGNKQAGNRDVLRAISLDPNLKDPANAKSGSSSSSTKTTPTTTTTTP